VLQEGVERKLRVSLRSPHRLIPVHIQGRPPPYFILGGLVFTQVPRRPLTWFWCYNNAGLPQEAEDVQRWVLSTACLSFRFCHMLHLACSDQYSSCGCGR
jgi:hypothetical protein